ncbi:glycosyl hydrolase [Terriglobus aquaticus]|uniref:Glycosyl hydrolase n=2 Tax=Terriglobus aquaticus TaxID=940139 RepID=A0ABW9KPP2_9BACT
MAVTAPQAQTATQAPAWLRLTMPTASTVASEWITPPPQYGPEPYYGLAGAAGTVTLDTVGHDLDTMHALGFRAVTLQWSTGTGTQYLSPEWFAFFRQVVAEAKRRDMRIWIVDDAGYPSGFAGGRFTREHPELRMQALVATRTEIRPGTSFDAPIPANLVAISAVSDAGETQTVPVQAAHAHWAAPATGTWTVVAVTHDFRTSPTRSDTNPSRAKDGSQSLEDYLDPAATAQYLQFTHEAYAKAVGDEFGKTILGFRGDEPDYSIGGLPWTPKFFDTFQRVKGYDVRPYLPALLARRDASHGQPAATIPVATPQQQRVRADYYDVFSRMFRDGFFAPQSEWCAAHGLAYQVHLNHEELQIDLAHSEGDYFRDFAPVQIPGVDAIWHQIGRDTVSDFPRFASSAAHVYGKPLAFTESFAAWRPEPDIALARYAINEQLVRGINLFEMMYYPATQTGTDRGGPPAYMRDAGFPALALYTRRLSYVLALGHPAAHVALLQPREALWTGDHRADDLFVSMERALSEQQIDFDIVDEDAVASGMRLERGSFVSQSGNRYSAILVPRAGLLPSAAAERLRRFAADGGKLIFLGDKPAGMAARNYRDAAAFPMASFASAPVIAVDLPPVPTPPQFPPATPPAPMPISPELAKVLRSADPHPAMELAKPDAAVRLLHRTLADADVFLLFNESSTEVTNRAVLHSPGTRVERWDAETASIAALQDAKPGANGLQVSLHLAPYEAELLVVRR